MTDLGRDRDVDLEAVAQLPSRLAAVRERLDATGRGDSVELLAVTKTRSAAVARAAFDLGLVDLGENYAQELEAKAAELRDAAELPDAGVRWHMIGGLQRNKVKKLAGAVWCWQSVDRESLVTEIARRDPGARILVQVRPSGERDAKAGCDLDAAPRLVELAHDAGLQVLGCMTVGPTDAAADPRPTFAATRSLVERLGLSVCSMGMSRDLEAAVSEGSTMVRIGTDLFGTRKYAR
ncbi:MAG: YggS family pyridoxal phosphate enzyme [Acidimicrobiales bacterium]